MLFHLYPALLCSVLLLSVSCWQVLFQANFYSFWNLHLLKANPSNCCCFLWSPTQNRVQNSLLPASAESELTSFPLQVFIPPVNASPRDGCLWSTIVDKRHSTNCQKNNRTEVICFKDGPGPKILTSWYSYLCIACSHTELALTYVTNNMCVNHSEQSWKESQLVCFSIAWELRRQAVGTCNQS